MKLDPETALARMAAMLSDAFGPRLLSLVAYGSAAGGNHLHKRSDVNLLAILDRLDAASLDAAATAVLWWGQQGNPPLVMLSRDEQMRSAEIFPIESLDIKLHHRLLSGEDFFAQLEVRPELHRRQVEHELRGKLVRLRGAYLSAGNDAKRLEKVLLESVNAFLTLFRHALLGLGEPFVLIKEEVVAAAAARFGFSPSSFKEILRARRAGQRIGGGKGDAIRACFSEYLAAIQQVERALEQAHAQSPV